MKIDKCIGFAKTLTRQQDFIIIIIIIIISGFYRILTAFTALHSPLHDVYSGAIRPSRAQAIQIHCPSRCLHRQSFINKKLR